MNSQLYNHMPEFFQKICKTPKACILFSILVYQKLLSPDHSFWAKAIFPIGYCKFTPSCSMYARQAIEKHGVVRGGTKAVWRVIRCNPWSKGGADKICP